MVNFRLNVKKYGIFNNDLLNIYKKNYSNNFILYPFFKYFSISESFLWFTLVNEFDEIIGECSIANRFSKNPLIRIFEIHDVYIEKKFRGNNYAELMLYNVLYYLDQNYSYYNFIIKTDHNNYPAIKTYTKLCGYPEYKNRLAIFTYEYPFDKTDIQ